MAVRRLSIHDHAPRRDSRRRRRVGRAGGDRRICRQRTAQRPVTADYSMRQQTTARKGADVTGPLRGLRVLELGNMIAAPTAGCLLADFGARVIKVEHPSLGDDLRRWPPSKNGVPLWWKVTNRNKDLITLNLSTKRGQELCRRI